MKILHVIEGLGRGGAERRLVNDLTHLCTNGFEHEVCTLGQDRALAHEIEALGVPVHRLDLERLSNWRRALHCLRALVEAQRFDLVHSQLFWADCYTRVVAHERRLPSLVTLQSSAYQPGEFVYSRKRHAVETFMGWWSRCHYVAVSAYVRRSAIRHLHVPESRVSLIYNSVDVERFQHVDQARVQRLKDELGLEPGDQVLIMVGRMDPPKGHRVLLAALSLLKERLPHLKVLIVGQGVLEAALKAFMREQGLEGIVTFLGNRQEIPELLALSDVYVFPTKCEGLPLTVLEAMAMAKPCLASRIGPIEEIIERDGDAGYLVDQHTPQAWAAAIERVLCDANRALVGQRGYDVIRQRFAARRQAEAMGRLYHQLVHGEAVGS